ncbi:MULTISPECIES: DUF262 domain-containing protein [unclassified Chitinophaga]|uniref:DUF262 domain-containing protein n=1 Tax=unclassified Chitinophaga TaxID=2619133 RepID=UPI00301007C7
MARNIAPQDVTWFLDLNTRGRLDLSPPYQRRSVWTTKERKYFLDTVFNGYPCPPVFLYKSISDEGISTFHVVDGKQRLETIINFSENKLIIPNEYFDTNLAGKKWRQLTTEQKKIFWNYQFAVEMLDVVDAATVKEIFGRYNRTSKNLEPQELRHAKYDGWFITKAEEEAKKSEWTKLGISTTARARRMKDVQLMAELMIQILNNGTPIGFDHDSIEEYFAKYESPSEDLPEFSEEEFSQRFEYIKESILEFERLNQSITKFAKSSTHFFTLWSVLVSNNSLLSNINILANRYSEFMGRVTEILKSPNPESLLQGENSDLYEAPFKYAQDSRGANTEEPQRKSRHDILLNYLSQA